MRPLDNGGYQVISGHHRVLAAEQAGLAELPCWVRALDDAEAYMQLVLCNTQSELHPLEEGKHAAESGMDLKAYAEAAGKVRTTLTDKVKAFRVLNMTHMRHDYQPEDIGDGAVLYRPSGLDVSTLRDQWRNLAEIHAAPKWLWPALVEKMIEDGWTVAVTREKVAKVKDVINVPDPTPKGHYAPGVECPHSPRSTDRNAGSPPGWRASPPEVLLREVRDA